MTSYSLKLIREDSLFLKAKTFLIPYSAILFILSVSFGGVGFSVLLFFIFYLSVIFLFRGIPVFDPRSLFFGFLFLYSSWFPIRSILFGFEVFYIDYSLLKYSVNLSLFGAIVFINMSNLLINEKISRNKHNVFGTNGVLKSYFSERLMMIVLFSIISIGVIAVLRSDATTKIEVSGVLYQLSHFSLLIIIGLLSLRLIRLKKGFLKDSYFMFFIFMAVLYVMVTGERDAAFRIILISSLIYLDKFNWSSPLISIGIVAGAAVIVPITQAFKAVLLSGELDVPSLSAGLLFTNEFISASRNLYSLILYEAEQSISFFYNDLLRAFVPTILLPGLDIHSTNVWYNSVFRPHHGFDGTAGWGFGIVAQGYLLGGYIGVAFIMSFYAFVLTLIYNYRYKSQYYYLFYLLTLVTAIYCIRADVANYLSQIFKVGGLLVLIVYSVHYLFKISNYKIIFDNKYIK